MKEWLALMATPVLVGACASITTGQDQPVSVDTPQCPAATCRLTNKEGTFFVQSTPGTVSVNRACGKLSIQCSRDGEADYVMTVSSSVKAMAFGNILFGGLIGAGVDTMTGAACEYPSLIPVPMKCAGASARSVSNVPIPPHVTDTVARLECREPAFVARAPDGKDVFTARCATHEVILTCNEKECGVSEIDD